MARWLKPAFGVDDIAITGLPIDGGETDPGWTYAGFIRTTGTVAQSSSTTTSAEFRQYLGYDEVAARPARTTSAS